MNERENILSLQKKIVLEGYYAERVIIGGEESLIIRAKTIKNYDRFETVLLETLNSLGFLPNLSGTIYIREAVKIETARKEKRKIKMKELYPLIAQEYSTTAIRVERAIRHATEVAWNRSGAERFNCIFGKNLFGKYLRPTSSELICLLSDKITFG